MKKTVNIKINNFSIVPSTLRDGFSRQGNIVKHIEINLANLYHHYYLDSYGLVPPDPNPRNFEYLSFLTDDPDFRIQPDSGIGISTAAKRNRSYDLGQAFFRLFLSQNLGIVYFAHMDSILDKKTHQAFGGLSIKRASKGDVPDYLCARNTNNKIYIGEAKGRYTAINFTTKEFNNWRKQFSRIKVADSQNRVLSIKGYIVGTRFVTSKYKPNLKTTIYAEDPKTPGDLDINEFDHTLNLAVISQHYSNIARKLKLPYLSESLDDIGECSNLPSITVSVWKIKDGPLKGVRFVGSKNYANICPFIYNEDMMKLIKVINHLANIDCSISDIDDAFFFGLYENVFTNILCWAKGEKWENNDTLQINEFLSSYRNSSLLKDGSIIMPFELLEYVETKNY